MTITLSQATVLVLLAIFQVYFIWAYGKAGNGSGMETGNGNWKWKMEMEVGNGNLKVVGLLAALILCVL